MPTASNPPVVQPGFDSRIYTLTYPLGSGKYGTLKRGFMVWEKAGLGYTSPAYMHFLYNPSTVTASYAIAPDSSVSASLLFPTAFDSTNLRVPLNQSVTWSLLFDRTYELWGQYDNKGHPAQHVGPNNNNPAVVGVLADIRQMQQFTGMNVGYSSGNGVTPSPTNQQIFGHQGIIQLVPSYVYFGDKNNLWFYGYISEWDVTVTHWTQFMVPMRCVINITFTMLPTPSSAGAASNSNTNWQAKNKKVIQVVSGGQPQGFPGVTP